MSKNSAWLVCGLVGLLFLACFEVLIWGEPVTRHFTLAGHICAQAAVILIFGFFLVPFVESLAEAWESREVREARLRAELARHVAAEAKALAEREEALGL